MSVRASNNEHLQIVFLIDENSTNIYDGTTANDASNSVCLCVLRILSYFNERRSRTSSNLRWGFKFYNSRCLIQKYERHNFKEFCVSEFEKFEKDVIGHFDEEFKNQTQEQEEDKALYSDEEFAPNTTLTKPSASKTLTCALTDLVHDFQWEANDLNSPLRTTRRSSTMKQNSRRTRNLVFLFTKCPKSFDSLREFSGNKIEDLVSLRNAIMSPALFREFNDVYKINLHWINTDYSENSVMDKDVIDMMEAFLQVVNGSLIPLQSLVHVQKHLSSSPGYTNTEYSGFSKQSSLLVPVMSVLSQYMRELKDTLAINQMLNTAMKVQNSDAEEGDNKLWIGLLCSRGVKPLVHCTLQLSSMLSPHCQKMTEARSSNSTKECTLLIDQQIDFENTIKCHTIATSSENPSTKSEDQVIRKSGPNLFWIKGAIRREKVCPSWFHLTKVYSCIAMVTEKENVTGSGLSGWFQSLMMSLAKQNLLLVIELSDPECDIPVTSVLQPLTSVCGVLNIINSCRLITIEKLLLWNQGCCLAELSHEDQRHLVEDLDVPSTLGERKVRTATTREIHYSIQGQSLDEDSSSSKSFSTQDLNSWSLGLACLQQGPDIVQHTLSTKISDEENSHESSLIKQLKELYGKKKTKQSQIVDKKQQKRQREIKEKQERIHKKNNTKLEQPEQLSRCLDVNKGEVLQPVDPSSNISSDKANPLESDIKTKSDEEKNNIELLLESLQLNGEQDVIDFLKDTYHQAVTNVENLTEFIEKCIAVVNWYLRKIVKTESLEMSLQALFTDHLLLNNLTIRDKYEGQKMSECKQNKLSEYQLQVLLRLEIICTGGDQQYHSTLIDEVVVMLRSISFIKDPGFLRDFLKEVILTRYVQRIPKLLCEIYEGLMQDLPSELLSPSKQNSSEEEESPLKRCQNSSIVRPESDQPRSEIRRPITRHRSIADMGGKRREIIVPGKAKPKTKTGKIKHDKIARPTSLQETRSDHPKTKAQKTPVKKVRRNLFTEEEEEETMEMTSASSDRSKNKLKVPSIFAKEERSRQHRHKDSRRHSAAACLSKVVRETPCRKQIGNALWQKQHRARKRTSTVTDLNIVQESPLKEILAADSLPRRSPRRHPGSIFQRSQSFYGQNPQSCPLVRTRSSSTIRSGSPIKKLNLDENFDANNLASDTAEDKRIISSITPVKTGLDKIKESPIRFSPRRRKRFALHTLLAETKAKTERELLSTARAVTPKSKREAPVRSSPRLLQKRSFSCIGFSNSNSFGNSGNSLGNVRKTWTPKKKALTPTRSSPRLKKSASDSCEIGKIQTSELTARVAPMSSDLRKILLQSPSRSVKISDLESIECTSQGLGGNTMAESKVQNSLLGSSSLLVSSYISGNEHDPEDSEIVLNLRKQPSMFDGPESHEEFGFDRQGTKRKRSLTRDRDVQEACHNGSELFQTAHPASERGDEISVLNHEPVENRSSRDEVEFQCGDHSITAEENNIRILRSSQKRSAVERSQESNVDITDSSPQTRSRVFRCSSDNTGYGERDVSSRKRLSFSPSRKTKGSASVHEVSEYEFIERGGNKKTKVNNWDEIAKKTDDEDSNETNVQEVTERLACETRTRSKETEDSSVICGKNTSPLRRSPRKHLTKGSPVCGSQRLLTPKPIVSTPPAKKRRKTRNQTEQESKRSSPLNQILKQRKRNRPEGIKSPHLKAHSEIDSDHDVQKGPIYHEGPREAIEDQKTDCFAQLAVELLDECSRSSEDMVHNWFTLLDQQEVVQNFCTEKTDFPKVHNILEMKNSSFEDEDDDVFQNPSTILPSKKPYKPGTPISAKSIQTLRESPLLLNTASVSVPRGSISKRWSDFSPVTKYGRERLKRRKRSEAFGGHLSELDTSTSDDGENIAERSHENTSTRTRKRIKLETN